MIGRRLTMYKPTKALACGFLALACGAAAFTGCATEQSFGNDPSKWPAPDDSLLQSARPFHLSVTELLDYVDRGQGSTPPLPGWTEEITRHRAYLQAQMYIQGVLDAGPAGQWCIVESGMPPHEVERALLDLVRKMPGDQNAAAALQDAASRRFPCESQ